MKEKPRCLIFTSKDSLAPKGGPSAVCYYYNQELEKRKSSDFEFLPSIEQNKDLHVRESVLKNKVPRWIYKLYEDWKQIVKYNTLLGGKYPVAPFDYTGYDIVHFHDVRAMYTRRYELQKYNGIIILQSHTPQPTGHELLNSIPKSIRMFIPFLKKRLEKMDKTAFDLADYIIFPCEDAEEPYFNDWRDYSLIHETKKDHYRYVLTGIPEATPKRNRSEVLKELGIKTEDFMISYVGRHNVVKGYDILKSIGEKYLNQDPNAWVVCAGKEEPITRLQHNRWIEIGWTNDAHSYISASDVFILPNKETYFDIVMLEVLSLGKIVIASRTGGNKYFEKAGCEGVLLYDTIEDAVELLKKVRSMSQEQRYELGRKNYEFYKNNNTVASMYDSYVNTLNEIYKLGKNG